MRKRIWYIFWTICVSGYILYSLQLEFPIKTNDILQPEITWNKHTTIYSQRHFNMVRTELISTWTRAHLYIDVPENDRENNFLRSLIIKSESTDKANQILKEYMQSNAKELPTFEDYKQFYIASYIAWSLFKYSLFIYIAIIGYLPAPISTHKIKVLTAPLVLVSALSLTCYIYFYPAKDKSYLNNINMGLKQYHIKPGHIGSFSAKPVWVFAKIPYSKYSSAYHTKELYFVLDETFQRGGVKLKKVTEYINRGNTKNDADGQ